MIRPLMVVRFLTASLGVALCVLPATASAADAAQKPGQAQPHHLNRQEEARVFGHGVAVAPRHPGARSRHREGPRAGPAAQPPRGDDAAVQDRLDGRHRARRPGGGRYHLQPGDRPDPLRGELPGQAIHCEHHEGDDRPGVPRRQPGPLVGHHDRAERRLRGLDDVSQGQRADHRRSAPAPAPHRLRQRRRACARPDVPRRHARSSSSG